MDSTPRPDPTASNSPAVPDDWEIWRLRLGVPKWLQDNPGLAITAVYVGASLIGIIYNFLYFRRFRINVLEFSEASDFLMVVIREPLTIALALFGIPFYLLYMAGSIGLTRWLRRTYPSLSRNTEKMQRYRAMQVRFAGYIQFGFILTYALLFVVLYSKRQAEKTRSGEHYRVTVEYKTDMPESGTVNAVLVGTTGRFVFLYHPGEKRSEAVPIDGIARMKWDARPRREREADEAKERAAKGGPSG